MPLNKYLYKNHNNELLNNTKEVFDKKLFIQYYIKYFVHAIFVVIGFVGTVHIWRGLWLLQPMIYQDEKILIKVVICLVAIIASLFILSLLDRISGALSRGNCKDEVFFIKGKFIVIETLSTRIFPKRVGVQLRAWNTGFFFCINFVFFFYIFSRLINRNQTAVLAVLN